MNREPHNVAPAPIFNHRKRPRQAVIADPSTGPSYTSNQSGTSYVQTTGTFPGQQQAFKNSGAQGISARCQGQTISGRGQEMTARGQGGQGFTGTGGQQPGPAGAAMYTDLMPVGGFGGNAPQRGPASARSSNAQQKQPGQAQRNSVPPAYNSNYNNSFNNNTMATNSYAVNNNTRANNNNAVNSNNRTIKNNAVNNNFTISQTQGPNKGFSNKQTFSRNTVNQNQRKNATPQMNRPAPAYNRSASTPFQNLVIQGMEQQFNPYPDNKSSYQPESGHFSAGPQNKQYRQNCNNIRNAPATAVGGPGINQSRPQPVLHGGQQMVPSPADLAPWGDTGQQTMPNTYNLPASNPPLTQRTSAGFKTSWPTQTDRGLVLLTVDCAGIQRWAKHKDTVHMMMEFNGYLDSAIARGAGNRKEFLLRDERKQPLNCVFYEIDRPLPKIIRGQWQRVVGHYDAISQKLHCLSVRPQADQERALLPSLISRTDHGMAAISMKTREL